TVVHEVKIDGNVGSASLKARRGNAANRSPSKQTGNVFGDVRPGGSAVFRIPDLTIVRARPDQSLLDFRRSDREHHFSVELPQIVADDSSGGNNAAPILRRKIRAGHRPTFPAVRRLEN